jgi:hypothetical protein
LDDHKTFSREKAHLVLFLTQKCQQKQHVIVTIVPDLATLGGMTETGSFLFFCLAVHGQGKYSQVLLVLVLSR